MIAMEDVDFQRNGTVIVVSADNWDASNDFDFVRWRSACQDQARLTEGLPGSMHGVHICFPQNGSFREFLYSALIKMTVSILNPLLKVRVRIHRGTLYSFDNSVPIIHDQCLANTNPSPW